MTTPHHLQTHPQRNPDRDFTRPGTSKLTPIRGWAVLISLLCASWLLHGCSGRSEVPVLTVGAASSLMEPLNELAKHYTEKTGTPLQLSFAASGTLRRQVEEGAPFDLIFLASEEDILALTASGKLIENTEGPVLGNALSFVSSVPAELETLDAVLSGIHRIALGDPASAPVGQYAVQALESLGLTNFLEGKALYAKDARQVLQYLNTGAVEAGILFVTDARKLEREFFILPLPESSHRPIRYPAALVADSPHQEEAQRFLDYLLQPESLDLFTAFGFTRPEY